MNRLCDFSLERKIIVIRYSGPFREQTVGNAHMRGGIHLPFHTLNTSLPISDGGWWCFPSI